MAWLSVLRDKGIKMKTKIIYFLTAFFLINFSIVKAEGLPHLCPINGDNFEEEYWLVKNNKGGTFVAAYWTNHSSDGRLGQIECVYVRGNGSLLSKFNTPRPFGGKWQGLEGKLGCLSVAEPAGCKF